MKRRGITDEMYARIPALLEQGMGKAEIAALYRVTPGSLKVLCSQRGISLRRGGPYKRLSLELNKDVLKSLRKAARFMGKGSPGRLASDLLETIVSDNLYKAVLDKDGPAPRVAKARRPSKPRAPLIPEAAPGGIVLADVFAYFEGLSFPNPPYELNGQ
jgi:hypothetical protein